MAGTSSSSTVTTIKYGTPVEAKDRTLLGAGDLASKYGNVDYDRGQIESIFQKATDAEYAAKQKEYDRSATQYYNRLSQSQNAYLDSMRKSAAQNAVQSGAAQGMQAANQLSAMLGMSQQTSADATALAQQQRLLSDQQAAAKTAATKEALTYANQQKLALGTLGSNLYATDAQKYVGELGANAQVGAANTAASAQGYAADQGLTGVRYNADKNLEGAQTSAAATRAAAAVTAAATRDAAASNYAASKYAADSNYAAEKYAADATTAQQWNASVANTTVAAIQNGMSASAVLDTMYKFTADPGGSSAQVTAFASGAQQPATFGASNYLK